MEKFRNREVSKPKCHTLDDHDDHDDHDDNDNGASGRGL